MYLFRTFIPTLHLTTFRHFQNLHLHPLTVYHLKAKYLYLKPKKMITALWAAAQYGVFSQPFNSDTFVDANKVDALISRLKTAAASKCVSYSPDETTIENYGLSNPQYSIKVNYSTDSGQEKEAVLYLGKENDDGSIYIMFEGAGTIGLLDSETASSLKEYFDGYKYVPQSICAV